MTPSQHEAIVKRFFSDAHVREVPAGHSVRYQIEATQGITVRALSSHLHLSPESAWKAADKTVRSLYREVIERRGRIARTHEPLSYVIDSNGALWKGPSAPDDTLHWARFEGFNHECQPIWVLRRSARPDGSLDAVDLVQFFFDEMKLQRENGGPREFVPHNSDLDGRFGSCGR